MNIQEKFKKHFDEENLKNIFINHIRYSSATGIDNLNQYSFNQELDKQVKIISRKTINGTYKFSKFKLKLISKGKNKIPREISIPTVRDRIALKALCNFLQEVFKNNLSLRLPQDVIKDVKSDINSDNFDGYIKLDVSNFYPSIKHDLLKKQLKKRIRHENILNIIFSAITQPTVSISRKSDIPSNLGIPQGLSISNVLANIYMQNIDNYLSKMPEVKCYRYVDDILIFCNYDQSQSISKEILTKFKKFGLKVYCPTKDPHKSKIGSIETEFDYLGYSFNNKKISVRNSSIEKLESSLAGIFTSYKYATQQNLGFLEWRVNLRITGCVFTKKCKGWLFFFSEINDENLLHCLDNYVKKLCNRFNVKINTKKFSKAHKEITHAKYKSKYVPNFDNYTTEKMKDVLVKYFNFKLENLKDEEKIRYFFYKKIDSQVKELEVDIRDFGY